MREKILINAQELFLNYGFKSITMDDISNHIGISKKTIYQHFENKTTLVEAVSLHVFDTISCGIGDICSLKKNPIDEIYDIKSINVEFISRIYFNSMTALKDKELFPLDNFSMNTLMEYYLEYHLRGICTEKGLLTLNKFIKNH